MPVPLRSMVAADAARPRSPSHQEWTKRGRSYSASPQVVSGAPSDSRSCRDISPDCGLDSKTHRLGCTLYPSTHLALSRAPPPTRLGRFAPQHRLGNIVRSAARSFYSSERRLRFKVPRIGHDGPCEQRPCGFPKPVAAHR